MTGLGRPRALATEDAFNILRAHIETMHLPPTVRELPAILGVRSDKTARIYLQRMVAAGLIARGRGARTITIIRSAGER